jgi:GNAT superfamily N-acetyltransferase
MTTAITLAGPDDAPRVVALMARYHEEAGLPHDDAHRMAVVTPLLDGGPLGAVWLIGPQNAPLGYVLVTFGWSVPHGGMIGWLAEVFIRPSVRNRGIGTEVLHAVAVSLSQVGMKAMHAHMKGTDARAARFCARVGFQAEQDVHLMTDPM